VLQARALAVSLTENHPPAPLATAWHILADMSVTGLHTLHPASHSERTTDGESTPQSYLMVPLRVLMQAPQTKLDNLDGAVVVAVQAKSPQRSTVMQDDTAAWHWMPEVELGPVQ
jgi:hypothetical protein